jgi:hypothetical protein
MHDSKVSWGNDERLQEKHCLFRDDFERGLRETFECVSDFRTCFKNKESEIHLFDLQHKI